jgi:hypothetical protein
VKPFERKAVNDTTTRNHRSGYNNFNEKLFNARFTDLGPFRAIKKCQEISCANDEDKTYGWTVEIQLKSSKTKNDLHEFLFIIK